jgi:SH3 domain
MAEALYAYTDVSNTTSQQQHLTLAIGDKVEIINKGDDGWWLGKINGQTGLFPGNYVRELPVSSSTTSSSSALLSLGLTAAGTSGSDNSGSGGTADDIEQERAFEGEQVQEQVLCGLCSSTTCSSLSPLQYTLYSMHFKACCSCCNRNCVPFATHTASIQ